MDSHTYIVNIVIHAIQPNRSMLCYPKRFHQITYTDLDVLQMCLRPVTRSMTVIVKYMIKPMHFWPDYRLSGHFDVISFLTHQPSSPYIVNQHMYYVAVPCTSLPIFNHLLFIIYVAADTYHKGNYRGFTKRMVWHIWPNIYYLPKR